MKPTIHLLSTKFVCLVIGAIPILASIVSPVRLKHSFSELVPICTLQGSGFQSGYQGSRVTTRGVVHGDRDDSSLRGFFLQDENCDGNPYTSDGIFVYLGERVDVVGSGDRVEVTGVLQEYYGLTEIVVSQGDVKVISSGNPLPIPLELNPPFDDLESSKYLERLEGMRVKLSDSVTVGPTDNNGHSWLVRSDLGIGRVFQGDPRGTGEIICAGDEGSESISPQVKVGDRITDLVGAQDYRGGEYCLQLFQTANVYPSVQYTPSILINFAREGQVAISDLEFNIATFNLANLFDTVDDPATEDTVLSAQEYQRRLAKRALTIHDSLLEPELIAIQEAENLEVLQALTLRPEIIANYEFIHQDGPDQRGLDIGLLYRTDRIIILDSQVHQGCTKLVDGLGPDGNHDVYNPTNAMTCDTNADGVLDGNRLFSRPPLIVELLVCAEICYGPGIEIDRDFDQAEPVYLIVNHWKSKLEDSEVTEYTLPRRIDQALFVRSLVEEIFSADSQANIILLGDLNDHPESQPLAIVSDILSNQFSRLPRGERYTYVYRGRSQILDHILVLMKPELAPIAFNPIHINADYPIAFEKVDSTFYRSSDHDPLLMTFGAPGFVHYLPLVYR